MLGNKPESNQSPAYESAPQYEAVTTPQCYHIYRESICDRNAIIKHKDKSEAMFYVKFNYQPQKLPIQTKMYDRTWTYTFRWLDKDGPQAIVLEKLQLDNKQFSNCKIIECSSGKEVLLDRGSEFSGRKYKFELDGITYAWKGVTLSADMQLLQYPEKKVVAMYHRKNRFSFKKEGNIEMQPEMHKHTNFVIASGFGAEIWETGDE
ncbi:hypothetical protein HDV01_001585 [Terramyces sp. JEL0728]|nr:hypothetical protein HDV01_001585 [Terramyces sp. JEL0728]